MKEVQEYVVLSTSSHSMISMRSLTDHFLQAPFGYTDNDTKWLVAKLFKDGKISATVEKEPISPFNMRTRRAGNVFYFPQV